MPLDFNMFQNIIKYLLIISLITLVESHLQAQIPEFKKPIPATMDLQTTGMEVSNNVVLDKVVKTDFSPLRNINLSIQERNKLIIEQDLANYANHQKRREEMMSDIISGFDNANSRPKINYQFPSSVNKPNHHYRIAFNQLKSILQNEREESLRDAVFIVENAFFGNSLSKDLFDKFLKDASYVIYNKMKLDGISDIDNKALNFAIFEYMTDTIRLEIPGIEGVLTHYPMTYDFDDPWGRTDWTKQFVSKLMSESTGQCHSLPLLYMLLAEEIGAKAHLSYAPQHSYIKFEDGYGNWYNAELTNGMFTTDNFIANSGYVKVEAISNQIYMDTLSYNQALVHNLVDLAKGYRQKFGYDDFYLEMVNYAIGKDRKNVFARMMKANYHTELFGYIYDQYKSTGTKQSNSTPRGVAQAYQAMTSSHAELEALGYEDIPLFVYEKWLSSLQSEKNKKEHLQKYNLLKGTVIK